MRIKVWLLATALLACAGPAAIAAGADVVALADWPETARLTAARLIEEFGPPDRRERLVWLERGLWKRITLWNTASPYGDPAAGGLKEAVACRVPLGDLGELTDFDKTVRVSQEGTMLSARSASEELNFLKLNLAHEIIEGKMGPSQARADYARTFRLAAAGKSSALLRGLLFSPTPARNSRWPVRIGLGQGSLSRDPLWRNEPGP